MPFAFLAGCAVRTRSCACASMQRKVTRSLPLSRRSTDGRNRRLLGPNNLARHKQPERRSSWLLFLAPGIHALRLSGQLCCSHALLRVREHAKKSDSQPGTESAIDRWAKPTTPGAEQLGETQTTRAKVLLVTFLDCGHPCPSPFGPAVLFACAPARA
jgi:hypothetical protein